MAVHSGLVVKGTGGTGSMEVVIALFFARARYVFLADITHDGIAIGADHLIAAILFNQFDSTLGTSPHHGLTPGFFHLVSST